MLDCEYVYKSFIKFRTVFCRREQESRQTVNIHCIVYFCVYFSYFRFVFLLVFVLFVFCLLYNEITQIFLHIGKDPQQKGVCGLHHWLILFVGVRIGTGILCVNIYIYIHIHDGCVYILSFIIVVITIGLLLSMLWNMEISNTWNAQKFVQYDICIYIYFFTHAFPFLSYFSPRPEQRQFFFVSLHSQNWQQSPPNIYIYIKTSS